PFNYIEVLRISLNDNIIRSGKLNVYSPSIIKSRGNTGLFHFLNMIPLGLGTLRRIKKTRVNIVLSSNPFISIFIVFLKN
ncbi:unnamed protein product, partial [marine sediment metagenome]